MKKRHDSKRQRLALFAVAFLLIMVAAGLLIQAPRPLHAEVSDDYLYVADTTITTSGSASYEFDPTRYFPPRVASGVTQQDKTYLMVRWVSVTVTGADSGSSITSQPMCSTSGVRVEVYPLPKGTSSRYFITRQVSSSAICANPMLSGMISFGDKGILVGGDPNLNITITVVPRIYSGSTASGDRTFYISVGYSYPSRPSNIPLP